MIDWISERESLAQNFAGRAQSASSYMLSSRVSRRLKEQGEQNNQEIEQFRQEIQKRYLVSVANKFYAFPYTQLSFDNPLEDQDIQDLAGKTVYCLYEPINAEDHSKDNSAQKESQKKKPAESAAIAMLNDIRGERQKLSQILELISNRKSGRNQERASRSKEKRMAQKYGVILQEDEELLRKRLYTEPYEKQAGFIVKKK